MKNAYRIVMIFGLFFILFLIKTGTAQSTAPMNHSRYWISGGLGISSLGSLAGSVNGCVQYNRALFIAHATANSQGTFDDEFFDIGLLMGVASKSRKGHVSVAVGVSLVTGSRSEGLYINFFGNEEKGRQDITPTFGIPLEVQLYRNLGRFLGLGFDIYANINSEQAFSGITLNLWIGKLR